MSLSPLAKKLGFKPGSNILLLNNPKNYLEILDPVTSEIDVITDIANKTKPETIHFFAKDKAECIQYMDKIKEFLTPEIRLWISYPKQTGTIKSDLNRDILWKFMQENYAWKANRQFAVDDTWSAMKFKKM